MKVTYFHDTDTALIEFSTAKPTYSKAHNYLNTSNRSNAHLIPP